MDSFARPAAELGTQALGPLSVAAAPSPGQGLALDHKGKIPTSVLASSLTGRIDSAGAVTAGTGFTVNRSATGTYDITFTVAFTAAPTVMATIDGGMVNLTISITNAATTGVTVDTHTSAGAATNSAFHFVAFTTV